MNHQWPGQNGMWIKFLDKSFLYHMTDLPHKREDFCPSSHIQKQNVKVFMPLIKDTIDEHISKIQEAKEIMFSQLVDIV